LTNGDKINTRTPTTLHILIAPLDWGLGHATRCIPIIKLLLNQGHTVIFAAEGRQAGLLRQEFPKLELLPLPGYRLSYSAFQGLTGWKIFFQIPKILISIKRENRWLDTLSQKRKIDLVISDCRFGLHHKTIPTVFITHQLTIKSPFGSWTESFLRKINYNFINRFNECWVPDFEGKQNLAGELSHPPSLPRTKVKYIGGLSRFNTTTQHAEEKQYDVLIILSGPEPQRSIWEKKLLNDLNHYSGKAALVRGLPDEQTTMQVRGADVYNHLTAEQLCSIALRSQLVISRPGYTTVMDLVKLRKKSVLVPTPAQSEQEYLGEYLMQQQLCVCIKQQQFSLKDAFDKASLFHYKEMNGFNMELYKQVISSPTLFL
jgi:hypothetical protein